MVVSLPLPFGDRMTEFLDRIWGGFYGGFVLTAARKRSNAALCRCQRHKISLSHSLNDRTLRESTVR